MLHTTKTFELGNSIYFECVYRTPMGILADPGNPAWKITTKRGVVVASDATEGGPYERSTGLWYIIWLSEDIGDYVLEFSGSINGNPVKIRRPFKVIKTAATY